MIVRAYPEGVAFAYSFPGPAEKSVVITDESTGFKLPSGRAWMLPYDRVAEWSPAYEGEWRDGIPVGTAPDDEKTAGWCFPALFSVRGHWVLITEVGLDGASFAAHLQPEAPAGLYRIRLPEDAETYGVAPREATAPLPWQSPWRVIMVGDSPGAIWESSLVHHLSPPCALADISWIKPGRVSWSWWSDHSSGSDYDRLVPFVDLAAQLGWEYSLIDADWHVMKNGDIWKLNAYAKSRGVGLILWYNSGGKHTRVMNAGPRDLMDDPVIRDREMAKLEAAGIRGIKVDFFQSDKQHIIELYLDIIRDAARHHLLVDFHGATLPRGWTRTYPNLLSMEAVRGAEQYWDKNFAARAHTFHTIYPFTRNVVGPMDYTPVIFGDSPAQKSNQPHQTTNPHELALSVVFESGLQHFADTPANYLAAPHYVRDFLKIVPVAWDETRALAGAPGDLALVARRKGPDWFVAGLNGTDAPRAVAVPLGFLSAGEFSAALIHDAVTPRNFAHRAFNTTSATPLTVDLAGRGGFVLHLTAK